MKIIANTKRRHYLVELEEDELAKILGQSYASSIPTDRNGERFTIGTEMNVSESWNDLHRFRNAAAKITSAAETLRAVAAIADQCSAAYILVPDEIPTQPAEQ